jgi:mono/diheme cytochrome c family protein
MRVGLFSIAALGAVSLLQGQRAPLFKDGLQVLEKSCVKCHSPRQAMGGLDLSTFAGLMKGGASGHGDCAG